MNYDEALSYAMDLCSRQERCRSEVAEKLEARKISPDNIEKILDSLVTEKFIDEGRYAAAFINDRLRFNKWGKIKIRHMLARKKSPKGKSNRPSARWMKTITGRSSGRS